MSHSTLLIRCTLTILLATAFLGCSDGGVPDSAPASSEPSANRETEEIEAAPVAGVSFRHLEIGDLHMRVAEQGEGPLALLVHGWPESWYSWRHQIPALAEAGYRAVAPDMRGYGGTTAPGEIADYDIEHLCADLTGLIAALGETEAILIGHDWGAVLGWQCALLEPQAFSAVVNMSVPYRGRAERSPLETWRESFGDNFFYILYFQELDDAGRGIAEAEFDADPRGILSRLYTSTDTPRLAPTVTDPLRAAGGWIPRAGAPTELPTWLRAEDLGYYVAEFERAGFRGGINYYRNFDRNWQITPQLDGAQISQPSLFIAGEGDGVIGGATKEELEGAMAAAVPHLQGVHLIPEAGHWVQQERPNEVNALLLEFLASL